MKIKTTTISRLVTAALFTVATAIVGAQNTNTIAAEYVTAPGAGSEFAVKLVNKGPVETIAGFAFTLHYDPTQVTISGVTNNTGQSGAGVQYTLGTESVNEAGKASRILSATTLSDLKGATNLAEIKFQKKAGFQAPLNLQITDRATTPLIDGLQGASLDNIPHVFDTSAVSQ